MAVSDLGLALISSSTWILTSVAEWLGWLKCLPTLVFPVFW